VRHRQQRPAVDDEVSTPRLRAARLLMPACAGRDRLHAEASNGTYGDDRSGTQIAHVVSSIVNMASYILKLV
jgi:hypothetical protein